MTGSTICKRILRNNHTSPLSKFKPWNSSSAVTDISKGSATSQLYSSSGSRYINFKKISQLVQSNGKRLFPVDTLALVRRLETQGIPTKHAEAIAAAIIKVLNDSIDNVADSFMSKAEMQKIDMIQETKLSKFKSEVQTSQHWLSSAQNLGRHFALLQWETEKRKGDLEKLNSELRYEIDKVSAGQRLDLNLEKGRIRDELADQNAETTNLTSKLNKEIHEVSGQFGAAKYEVIKYCIGTLVSLTAIGLAGLRVFK